MHNVISKTAGNCEHVLLWQGPEKARPRAARPSGARLVLCVVRRLDQILEIRLVVFESSGSDSGWVDIVVIAPVNMIINGFIAVFKIVGTALPLLFWAVVAAKLQTIVSHSFLHRLF